MTGAPVVRVLLGALGGEGGGSVAGWIVEAAQLDGHRVQSTSIPGVAQRTGATTYYLEIVPGQSVQVQHTLALAPIPGTVDLVLASELVEAGRALQNGYVSPGETTLVMSTHRVFAVAEKAAMGDGRYATDRIEQAAARLAKRIVAFDMASIAATHRVPITVVLLGAAAHAMPVTRASFEAVISRSPKGASASVRAFAAGWRAAELGAGSSEAGPDRPSSGDHPGLPLHEFPAPVRALVSAGVHRLVDYQDRAYAELYLARVRVIAEAESANGRATHHSPTLSVARHAALWMSYEDVPRVAQVKTRLDRLDDVRRESGALSEQPIRVYEYLKPGPDELCAMLPPSLARALRRVLGRLGLARYLQPGLRIRSNGLPGFLTLRAIAELRRVRRFSSRWQEEQCAIEEWLSAVVKAACIDLELATEIAECGRLVKGYGATHARSRENFQCILLAAARGLEGATEAGRVAEFVRRARDAALADPEGSELARVLSANESGTPLARSRAPIMFKAVGHV